MKMSKLLPFVLMAIVVAGCGASVETKQVAETKQIDTVSPTVDEVLKQQIADTTESSTEVSTEADVSTSADAASTVSTPGTTASAVPAPEPVPEETVLSTIEGVDIDLTSLSSTMVYAQVYEMMFYPENFIGKTIRMEGTYSDYVDESTGKHYFGCIIQDATACCSQGVEFEPLDSYAYPDDYPMENDTVVVEGVFDLYQENGVSYCTLRNAKFI